MNSNRIAGARIRSIAALVALSSVAVALAGCDSNDGSGQAERQRVPVILDYSPTLSDAGALLYEHLTVLGRDIAWLKRRLA